MSEAAEINLTGALPLPKRHWFVVDLLIKLVKTKPLGTLGGVIVLVLLFTGIFANFLAPYGMNEVSLVDRLSGPSAQHLLGADHLGRDILSNLIWGARISMIIGVCSTILSTLVAVFIGTLSAQQGGKVDLAIQRFVDAWMSIPALLILLILMSMMGRGLVQVVLVIGIPMGIRSSRVIRSAVIGIRENDYLSAGRAIGCSSWRMTLRHILPNIMAPIIIDFTIGMGGAIMMESSLSFLGFGVPPGVPSWGSMLSAEGRKYMQIAPQLALYPGLALSIVVWGINMLGDAMRDLMDPRLRGSGGKWAGEKKKNIFSSFIRMLKQAVGL
jgi:peptide/nickel transport system permease protein